MLQEFFGVGRGQISMVAWPGVVGPNQKQLLGQMVEGAPKILDDIAGNSCEANWSNVDFRHIIDQLACLRIALGSDFIWVGFQESVDCTLEIADVLFSPFNFELEKRKSFIGSQRYSEEETIARREAALISRLVGDCRPVTLRAIEAQKIALAVEMHHRLGDRL
jgi:hypothetical protein